MPQYDGSIRIDTEIQTKQVEKEMKSLESSMEKTADKIASLRSKMDALKDVKLPTQEYKEISSQIEKAEQRFDKLLEKQKQMQRDGKDSGAAWQRLNDQIADTDREIALARGELKDLVDTGKAFTLGIDTEKYAEMSAQMQQLNQKMQSDTEHQTELQDALAEREQRLTDIKANSTVIDQDIIDLLERRKQLMQEIADMESAGVSAGYQQYDSAQQELSVLNSQIREYKDNIASVPERFSKMRNSVGKAFNAISNGIMKSGNMFSLLKDFANKAFSSVSKGAKQSAGLLSSFGNRLKSLAASAFIFNLISKSFSSLVSGMKTGFSSLMAYSGSFTNSIQSIKNSLSTFGNQIAAAFAPIVQAVIPWLNQLISVLSVAMSYAAQFIAALTGKATYIRAKKVQNSYSASLGGTAKKEEEVADNADNMSDSLDDTAKSAKKARGALAAFDDLDVLEKQDDSTDAAADKIKDLNKELGNLGSDGAGDLFEEVPIESNILDAVEKLKDILAQLFKPLKKAWEQEGEFVMKAWKHALDEVGKLIKDIGRDFLTVWNQNKTVKMFADILHIAGDIGLIIGNIAHALDEAWNKNNTGLHILENIRDILAVIIENIREAADFTVEWSKTLDFSPLLESIEHLTRALVPFADFVSGTLADLYTEFLLPLAKWTLSENGIPRLINILGDFMDAVDWGALREALKNLYAALEPYAEAVAEGLIDFLEEIKNIGVEILNALPEPIQKLADALKSGDPDKVREWTTTLLEFVAAVGGLKLAFSAFESVKEGLALFTVGGSVSVAGTTASEAAVGIGKLSGALSVLVEIASALGVLEMAKTLLFDLGEAAGISAQNADYMRDRYSGLEGTLNLIKDPVSILTNGIQGLGWEMSNSIGVSGALETAMKNAADGMIYTDEQLSKLQNNFGLTDDDIEMLRQEMLDTHPELRNLADNFAELQTASVESLEEIYYGLQDVSNGIYDADDASGFLYGRFGDLTETTKVFFDNMATGVTSIDDYKTSLESTSDAIQQFSDDIDEASTNIGTGLTEGLENADVETPVRGFFANIVENLRSVFDMHSPSKNMEPFGENILLGVLVGFKKSFTAVQETVSEFFQNMKLSFSESLQKIQTFFAETWTQIYESTIETWTLIQEYFTEFWTLFIEYLIETWEEILLVFTENFEEIQLLFEEFITFLNEIFLVSWLETWTLAGEQYQTFHDLITMLTKALQEMLTLFVKKMQELINTIWKQTWKIGEEVFEEFANRVEEVVGEVRSVLDEFFGWCLSMIQSILSGIASIATAASNISFGGFGGFSGGGGAAPVVEFSTQNLAAYSADIPMLANGAVLRGGNPFMAILNEQPAGRVNVEAPLSTIKQAVREELSSLDINSKESVPVTINLNWDGETFARLSISDILSELARQGYDVDVLGVT